MLLIGPWYAQHASLASGAAQCDIAIAINRISLSFAGNELGNAPTAWKQLRWRRRLDLICTSGQRRTNTLVARTYARWPLRASGVLDPLARTGPPSKKAAGPAGQRASGPAGQRSISRPEGYNLREDISNNFALYISSSKTKVIGPVREHIIPTRQVTRTTHPIQMHRLRNNS